MVKVRLVAIRMVVFVVKGRKGKDRGGRWPKDLLGGELFGPVAGARVIEDERGDELPHVHPGGGGLRATGFRIAPWSSRIVSKECWAKGVK